MAEPEEKPGGTFKEGAGWGVVKGAMKSVGLNPAKTWLSGSAWAEAAGLAPKGFTKEALPRIREIEQNAPEYSQGAGELVGGIGTMYAGGVALGALGGVAGVANAGKWVNPGQVVAGKLISRPVVAGAVGAAADGAAFGALNSGLEQASQDILNEGKVNSDHVSAATFEGGAYGGAAGLVLGGALSLVGRHGAGALKGGAKLWQREAGVGYLQREGVKDPVKITGGRDQAGELALDLWARAKEAGGVNKPAAKLAEVLDGQADEVRNAAKGRLEEYAGKFAESRADVDALFGLRKDNVEAAWEQASRKKVVEQAQKLDPVMVQYVNKVQDLEWEAAAMKRLLNPDSIDIPISVGPVEAPGGPVVGPKTAAGGPMAKRAAEAAEGVPMAPAGAVDDVRLKTPVTGKQPPYDPFKGPGAYADTASPLETMERRVNEARYQEQAAKQAAFDAKWALPVEPPSLLQARALAQAASAELPPPPSLLQARAAVEQAAAAREASFNLPQRPGMAEQNKLARLAAEQAEKQARAALVGEEKAFAKAAKEATSWSDATQQALAKEEAAFAKVTAKAEAKRIARNDEITAELKRLAEQNNKQTSRIAGRYNKEFEALSKATAGEIDSLGKEAWSNKKALLEAESKLSELLANPKSTLDDLSTLAAKLEESHPDVARGMAEHVSAAKAELAVNNALRESIKTPEQLTLKSIWRAVRPGGVAGFVAYASGAGPLGSLALGAIGRAADSHLNPDFYMRVANKGAGAMRAVAKRFEIDTAANQAMRALAGNFVPKAAGIAQSYSVEGASRDQLLAEDAERVNKAMSMPDQESLAARLDSMQMPQAYKHAAVGKSLQIAANIQRKLPKPVVLGGQFGSKPRYAESETMDFEEYVSAASDPESAIKALKDGSITMAQAEAMRDNYPEIVQQVKNALLDHTMAPMEEQAIRKLEIFFGEPLMVEHGPDFIKLVQQNYEQAAKTNQEGSQGGGSAPAQNTARVRLNRTASERVDGR